MVRRSRAADNATESYVCSQPCRFLSHDSQPKVRASHSDSSTGVFCGLTVECWREHERRHVRSGASRHAALHDVSWFDDRLHVVAPPRATSIGLVYSLKSSRRTSGRRLAIVSSERAAPVGFLRPCSQPSRVPADTPSTSANCWRERPVRLQASTMSGTFTWRGPTCRPASHARTGSAPRQDCGSLPTLAGTTSTHVNSD